MAYRYRHGKVGGFASAAKKLIASRQLNVVDVLVFGLMFLHHVLLMLLSV